MANFASGHKKSRHDSQMMVRVKHHIYTSFGGYGSFRTSDDLADDTRDHLDTVVGPLTAAASVEPTRSVFPIGDQLAITSTINVGFDHAGRPRGLSHTILVPRSVVNAAGTFLPYAIPVSRFVQGRSNVDLTEQIAIPFRELFPPASLLALKDAASDPAASALLAALLGEHRRTLIKGELAPTMKTLGALFGLIPLERRTELALLAGPSSSPDARAEVVVVNPLGQGDPEHGRPWVEARTGSIHGRLPHGVALFALSSFLDEGDPNALSRLQHAYERWSKRRDQSPPRAFVRAFVLLRGYFKLDGTLELNDAAWPTASAAIPSAVVGAAPSLGIALLADGIQRARRRQSIAQLRGIVRELRQSVSGIPMSPQLRHFLQHDVTKMLRELLAPPGGVTTWAAGPDAVRGLTNEIEELLRLLALREVWPEPGSTPPPPHPGAGV